MTRPLVFPTAAEAEADPRLCCNQAEVEVLQLYRSLPDHLKPELMTFLRRVTKDGIAFDVAAIDFLQASGLSKRSATRKIRSALQVRA